MCPAECSVRGTRSGNVICTASSFAFEIRCQSDHIGSTNVTGIRNIDTRLSPEQQCAHGQRGRLKVRPSAATAETSTWYAKDRLWPWYALLTELTTEVAFVGKRMHNN